jgi:ankyrin repeat protein
MPPLTGACVQAVHRVEIIKRLLAAKANVNQYDERDAWTALHFAACAGGVEAVRLLLDAGADVNAASKYDALDEHKDSLRTPLAGAWERLAKAKQPAHIQRLTETIKYLQRRGGR